MSLKWRLTVLAVSGVLVAVMSVAALAQPPRGRGPGGPGGPRGFGGPGGPGGGDVTGLLMLPQIQTELDLIEPQVADLRELVQSRPRRGGEGFRDLRNLSEDERRERFEQMRREGEERAAEMRKKVEEILLPHQMDRLREISIQIRGVGALNDPEIADALKLSEAQREQITKTQTEMREQAGQLFGRGGNGNGDREQMREQFEKLRAEINEKILAVLTTQQRSEFEKMQGAKFELDRSQLQGDRGGRPGEGGDQPRQRFRRPDATNRPAPDA